MNIVVLDGETLNPGDNPWDKIEQQATQFTLYPRTTADQTVARSQDADIVLTNKVPFDESVLAQLPQLKFIAVTATGYNVIDIAAAGRNNVLVANVPEYSTDAVAQHVLAGLLSFIHRPELHHHAILDGQWQRSGNFSFWKTRITELSGKTMGIIGLGKIGRATARLAHAFGMNIVASSRTSYDFSELDRFAWLEQDDLLASADVISLHCPQTSENSGMVDQRFLTKMKPTAILVNTARGGLVNEADLAAALNQDQIGGAILDVVSQEPINDDNPLLAANNCLLTPHIAWVAIEARQRMMSITANNVAAFIQGRPINLISN